MKLCCKIAGLALALLCSSTGLLAQAPSLSCRPLDAGNTFLDPDEKVVGGQACKVVTSTNTPQKQQVAQSISTPSVQPISSPTPAPPAISTTAPTGKTSASPSPATSTSDNTPSEAGMYLGTDGGFTKILGQILDFRRTGSMLASDLTLHVKTSKENVQLLGPHAQTVTGSSPVFYFIPAKIEADAGVNAGDLIMVRLEEKKERRQFEIGAQGAWRASKGISLTHQVQLSRSEVKPGVYKITPAAGLGRGEYGLYLSRGEGTSPYIYDFSVQ